LFDIVSVRLGEVDMQAIETRSDAQLVQAWLDNVRTHSAIEHVGAANRHFNERTKLERVFWARSAGQFNQLRPLLTHPDARVRFSAALLFRSCDPAAFRAAMSMLIEAGGEIGASAARLLDQPPIKMPSRQPEPVVDHPLFWPAHNPPPPGPSDSEIATRLAAALPDQAAALLQLIRPAIGLWPQAERADAPADGSRLGGMPCAPPGWRWPVAATEPMLFLGQINCADICGLPGAEALPSRGLLSLFGDHDTVMGCLFTGQGGALYYWPETSDLTPAAPPLEMLTVFPRAELLFRPLLDLPDPESGVVAAILHDQAGGDVYRRFHRDLRGHGLPREIGRYNRGKLLGWPNLLQGEDFEFTLDQPFDHYRMLLQLDGYTNGKEFADWGPGGFLYYFIPHNDFAEQHWETAELAIQFT
jgi:hypothetical protein